jgi:hypothetical protein
MVDPSLTGPSALERGCAGVADVIRRHRGEPSPPAPAGVERSGDRGDDSPSRGGVAVTLRVRPAIGRNDLAGAVAVAVQPAAAIAAITSSGRPDDRAQCWLARAHAAPSRAHARPKVTAASALGTPASAAARSRHAVASDDADVTGRRCSPAIMGCRNGNGLRLRGIPDLSASAWCRDG